MDDTKLARRAAEFVEPGERLVAVFPVAKGPRFGMEALFGPFLGFLGGLAVMSRRKWFTIIITDTGVVLFRNRRGRPLHPDQVVARRPKESLGPLHGEYECWIELSGERYWVPLKHSDAARNRH